MIATVPPSFSGAEEARGAAGEGAARPEHRRRRALRAEGTVALERILTVTQKQPEYRELLVNEEPVG